MSLPTASEWFVVLPSSGPAAPRARARLEAAEPGAGVLATHNGRVWLVGRLAPPVSVSVAQAGPVSVALIGDHDAPPARLEKAAERIAAGERPESVMSEVAAGCFHAIVATGARVWATGDVAGLRMVFSAQVAGCPVLGSDASTLARAAGNTRLDPAHLAAMLLSPVAPLGVLELGTSPYLDVAAVPPGCAARVDDRGRITLGRWWSPPDDDLTVEVAAPLLRDALGRAVALRTTTRDLTGCELSGGLDSTSIAMLAYQHAGERLRTFTRAASADRNDDADWARCAAAHQAGAQHLVVDAGTIPEPLDGLGEPLATDAPGPSGLSPWRSLAWWRVVTRAGSQVLLSGKGGDEVMLAALPYLHLARSRDRRTAREHRAGWAALWNTPLSDIRAQAADPGPYRTWLTGCLAPQQRPRARWEARPVLPPWLTAYARELLDGAVATAVRNQGPLHERVHQHTALAAVRATARLNRLQAAAARAEGLHIAYPFADRQVIEAVLACRAEQRISPFEPRPLLRAAMRGIVPDTLLARRTKGGYSAGDDQAARRHRHLASALLQHSSVLSGMGLIEPGAIAAPASRWGDGGVRQDLLVALTVQAEVWARAATGRTLPAASAPEGS